MKKIKKGAASFYIVAISTLILVIIAASFIGVIISEVTRTSNDDLAQSAYDSALAGIEDAKLAYYSYQNCKNNSSYTANNGMSCNALIKWVEDGIAPESFVDSDSISDSSCDMVSYILGRNNGGSGEVPVQEGNTQNNMQQAYTCVTITNKTDDVLGTLSESDPEYTVRIKFENQDAIKNVKKVRVKWHLIEDGETFKTLNRFNNNSGLIEFTPEAPVPAVLAVGMIQTSAEFSLDSFDMTRGNQTNRGTLYLVPSESETEGTNSIGIDGFLKSNDKTSENTPYIVKCNGTEDYKCMVDIKIPQPIGEDRSGETFIFKVALPYGKPSTSFSLEFFCNDDNCSSTNVSGNTGEEIKPITLKDVQIKVDSTGRANDLYRRVEMRLEAQDVAFPYPIYGIQALGNDGKGASIIKNVFPTSEYGL